MELVQIVKKAMIDSKIETMEDLANKADITYYKVSGFLNGGEGIKLVDLKSMLAVLNLNIKLIGKGEE